MKQPPHIAIAGATGAVGIEMLKCLVEQQVPFSELTLLASARSAGKEVDFQGKKLVVQELTEQSFEGVDIALFSAGGSISEKFAPHAAAAGAIVIDNSSAFRMDPEVPLVVPEINPEAAQVTPKGIIANPNCTTIISLMALAPLHREFGLKAVIASSYQAVSGSGAAGIVELDSQIEALANGGEIKKEVYPHQIASNVIPHVDVFQEGGYTKEELKMLNESRKILSLPELQVTCTCVRVPVHRSHAVSISAQFEKPVTVEAAQAVYGEATPGVQLCDDPAQALYPTPLDTTEKDDCLVGRMRMDKVLDNALALWVVGDQVKKGAALNAVQIAKLLLV
ncbi:aspartate-semialdehyde dehydrogenase [Roseibacillus ishigakijimensis]|uniref:Aspartate-semialdehyde dehydrogenase n=1 Tax=Roseibacillus ishigakijimensis TaxID=454146 RepID=A0A934RPW8_9BACT|nr:aspartate-semialdehyde dehydrogenase [Roseibacillus ishigakijimensis]MBK1835319.1 aspartate-semialdehyde dehydrogenase [Roseibacillus ishigakijimensis]